MGYAAARGGLAAVAAAEHLVRNARRHSDAAPLQVDQLTERQRLAVDRVMSEGSLWAPALAAAALIQAEGDIIEAAQLLRSHRSTLPRLGTTEPIDPTGAPLLRRVVPAYQNPPGPQLLGRTVDYSGRLLECRPPASGAMDDTADETVVDVDVDITDRSAGHGELAGNGHRAQEPGADDAGAAEPVIAADGLPRCGRLLDLLRDLDLLVDRRRRDDPSPYDITRDPVRPGVPRSARLATMARAETGALVNLWYRNILGPDDHLHEVTLGEVRHARLPLPVTHPHSGRPVVVGHIRVTEVEAIEDLDGPEEDRTRFDAGYGLCAGHNERKAIAMANLDIAVHRDGGRSGLEQSVLVTTDGLDASGFLEHLKLPHYVTFRSMVERKVAMAARQRHRRTAYDDGRPTIGERNAPADETSSAR
ncbi:MAG: carbon-phosphorus lyase complex subunit PhnI [Acidimicrobiia bacterium]|nr:carbon-phosphorus lyase complex subunit PhnI [Acidimicrobiia bacterium]